MGVYNDLSEHRLAAMYLGLDQIRGVLRSTQTVSAGSSALIA
jgi:hypothetical protein